MTARKKAPEPGQLYRVTRQSVEGRSDVVVRAESGDEAAAKAIAAAKVPGTTVVGVQPE